LWEHKQATLRLRDAGKAAVNESLLFAAIEAQRLLVTEAIARTNRARRNVARVRHFLEGEPSHAKDADVKAPSTVTWSEDPYLPYPVEEWS
jgi:putative transposase